MLFEQYPVEWQKLYPNFYANVQFLNTAYGAGGVYSWRLFETLYRASWVAARIVNCIADDMTEKWRVFEHSDPKVVQIRTDFEWENDIPELFNEAIRVARKYGGGCIQPMLCGQINEESLAKPFDLRSVREGDLECFQVLNRFDYAPFFGYSRDIVQRPILMGDYEYYKLIRIQNLAEVNSEMNAVNADLSMLPTVHRTWMNKFYGTKVEYYQKMFAQGWSDSVLAPLINKIPAVEESFHLLFSYLDMFNIDYIKVPNLVGMIQSGSDDFIRKCRVLKDNLRLDKLKIVDADDDMQRKQISGMTDTVNVFDKELQFIVGATGIPFTKIIGSSVGGWSTGDNELIQYYDLIAQQQKELRRQLSFVDKIIERHLFGKEMKIKYKFLPKQELSEKEKAELATSRANMFAVYIQNRVLTPKIVAENIKEELTGITDEYISTLDDEFLDYEEGMADIPDDEEDKEPKDEKEKDNS